MSSKYETTAPICVALAPLFAVARRCTARQQQNRQRARVRLLLYGVKPSAVADAASLRLRSQQPPPAAISQLLANAPFVRRPQPAAASSASLPRHASAAAPRPMRARSDEATSGATTSGSSLLVSVCDGTPAHGDAPDQRAPDPTHAEADLASSSTIVIVGAALDRAHADTSHSSASNSSGSSRSSRRGSHLPIAIGAHLVRERQKSEPTDLLDTADLTAALSAPADPRRNDPIFARAAQGRESAMATEANAAGLSEEAEGTKERAARHWLDRN